MVSIWVSGGLKMLFQVEIWVSGGLKMVFQVEKGASCRSKWVFQVEKGTSCRSKWVFQVEKVLSCCMRLYFQSEMPFSCCMRDVFITLLRPTSKTPNYCLIFKMRPLQRSPFCSGLPMPYTRNQHTPHENITDIKTVDASL